MESGPSTDRRPTRLSRVVSPRAANTGTASAIFRAAASRLRDMSLEVPDLAGPSLVVHPERLGSTRERDAIEPGLDDRHSGAAFRVVENEFDERGRLGGVVRGRIDR